MRARKDSSSSGGKCARSTRPMEVQKAGKRLPTPRSMAMMRVTLARATYTISRPSRVAMEHDSCIMRLKRSRMGCAAVASGMEEIYEWPRANTRGCRKKWRLSSEPAKPSLESVYKQRRTAARENPVLLLTCEMVSWRFFWEKAWMTARPRASEVMKSGSPVRASICAEGVGGAAGEFAAGWDGAAVAATVAAAGGTARFGRLVDLASLAAV